MGTIPVDENIKEQPVPWYETNLFWGPLALGVGILLAVVAAMKHDLKWLLYFAAPCFVFAAWALLRRWVKSWLLALCVLVAAVLIVAAGYWMIVRLGKPDTVQTPAPEPPKEQVSQRDAVLGWGAATQTSMYMTVNTAKITAPVGYRIFVSCRVGDSHIDALEDARIIKSATFPIDGQIKTIQVELTQEFLTRLMPHGEVQIFLVVVPPSVTPESISKLSDVASRGGVVWVGGGINVTPTVTKPRKPRKPKPQPNVQIEQHGAGGGAVGGDVKPAPCTNTAIGGVGTTQSIRDCTINPPTNPNKPVVTYYCNGTWTRVGPSPGGGITTLMCNDEEKCETVKIFKAMMEKNNMAATFDKINRQTALQSDAELLVLCEQQIKATPEWLTPYLFCSVANGYIGNLDEARKQLSYFDEHKGPSYDGQPCKDMAEWQHQELSSCLNEFFVFEIICFEHSHERVAEQMRILPVVKTKRHLLQVGLQVLC